MGVTIDKNLGFDERVSKFCSKANRNLVPFLERCDSFFQNEEEEFFNAFIESLYKYCSLNWMFHSRSTSSKLNRLHKRILRIVHNDYELSFKGLLEKGNSLFINYQNLHRLLTQINEVLNNRK